MWKLANISIRFFFFFTAKNPLHLRLCLRSDVYSRSVSTLHSSLSSEVIMNDSKFELTVKKS